MMIRIERIGKERVDELCAISRKTFYEAFGAQNRESDMQQHLDEAFNLPSLTKELAHPESAFYFASCDGQVAGYIKINVGVAQTELKEDEGLEIERIYVSGEFQSKGIGQALMDKAFSIAREKGKEYLWLGVWERNPDAIRFYERNGFVVFGKHDFVVGSDVQTDVLMRAALKVNIQK